jgi:hypothetical protein
MASGAVAGGTPPGAGALSAAALLVNVAAATHPAPGGEADWVTFQLRAQPDAIRDTLNRIGALLARGLRP